MAETASNGFESITKHVEAFEVVDAELEAMKMDYMNQCREKRESQKRIVKMIKAEGFAADSFKAVIKRRRLEKKIEAIQEELDGEDAVETYEQMLDALGNLADTPLSQAAVSGAAPKRAASVQLDREAIDALAGDDFEDADPVKAHIADNVTKLQAGIKPIH